MIKSPLRTAYEEARGLGPDPARQPDSHLSISHLYKYRAFPGPESKDRDQRLGQLRSIFERRTLYAAHVDDLNDYFERTFGIDRGESARRFHSDNLVHAVARDQFGVVSLSEDAENQLLWSYYAGGGTGFCVQFSRVGCPVLGGALCQPVRYSRRPRVLCVQEHGSGGDEHTQWSLEHLADVLWTKSNEWQHEAEWRLLWPEHSAEMECTLSVTGVVFGVETLERDAKMVEEWAEHIDGFAVGVVEPEADSYRLRVRWDER